MRTAPNVAGQLLLDGHESDGSVVVDGPSGIVGDLPDDASAIRHVGVVAAELSGLRLLEDGAAGIDHLTDNERNVVLAVDVVSQRERPVHRNANVDIETVGIEQAGTAPGAICTKAMWPLTCMIGSRPSDVV